MGIIEIDSRSRTILLSPILFAMANTYLNLQISNQIADEIETMWNEQMDILNCITIYFAFSSKFRINTIALFLRIVLYKMKIPKIIIFELKHFAMPTYHSLMPLAVIPAIFDGKSLQKDPHQLHEYGHSHLETLTSGFKYYWKRSSEYYVSSRHISKSRISK